MPTWTKVIVVALLAWRAGDSFAVRPHYLAYFAPYAGGSGAGYKHLVDSSLDWGMDLPGLRRWFDQHNPGGRAPVFLAYFGTDDPRYYRIKSTRLPGFFDWRNLQPYALRPGYYAISATLFEGVYVVAFGRWNATYEKLYRARLHNVRLFERTANDPAARAELLTLKPAAFWEHQYQLYDHLRFARLCAWLRAQGDPPHQVGHAIFIWKLDQASLDAALLGPPVELAETPPEWRQLVGTH